MEVGPCFAREGSVRISYAAWDLPQAAAGEEQLGRSVDVVVTANVWDHWSQMVVGCVDRNSRDRTPSDCMRTMKVG